MALSDMVNISIRREQLETDA